MGLWVAVMGRRRAIGAAALLLTACRSDGERGHAFTRAANPEPQGIEAWRREVPSAPGPRGTRAERDEMTTLATITQSLLEAQRAAAAMAVERMGPGVFREHAAEVVSSARRQLEALHAMTVAGGLDVATAALSDDPVIVAQREAGQREISRLRALSGAAFAEAWLTGEQQRLELLGSLAELGMRLSPDVAGGNVFRAVAYEARTQASRAATMAAHRPAG